MVATIDTACSNELGVSPENGHDKLCCGSGLVGVTGATIRLKCRKCRRCEGRSQMCRLRPWRIQEWLQPQTEVKGSA